MSCTTDPVYVCVYLGVCGKLKIGSDLVLQNHTIQKFDICSQSFPTETACNPPFKLKVTQNNFTCVQCADKERFKTRPKQNLAYRF